MAKSFLGWAIPGILFTVGFGFSACLGADPANNDNCVAASGGSGGTGGAGGGGGSGGATGAGGHEPEQDIGGEQVSGADGNNFHHPEDPSAAGQKSPFEILKERADEGPPEIRTRLHSCSRIPYTSIGAFLTSRGVNLDAVAPAGQPPTAGQLYKGAKDSLGAARFDIRQGEAYFYTVAAATKLFDIFVQAAPEIIANIENMPACQSTPGAGSPMFDTVTGKCVYNSVSCIMGRPATDDDMELCNLMIEQADPNNAADKQNKQRIAVAAFLSAAHTCE